MCSVVRAELLYGAAKSTVLQKRFWLWRRRELGRIGILRTDKLLILYSVQSLVPLIALIHLYAKLT